jgi:hypothetical protein
MQLTRIFDIHYSLVELPDLEALRDMDREDELQPKRKAFIRTCATCVDEVGGDNLFFKRDSDVIIDAIRTEFRLNCGCPDGPSKCGCKAGPDK